MPTTCLVAGGGTAGHLLPGLAVAEELVLRGLPRDEVRFVVSERAIDRDLVTASGFRWTSLPGRGIQRRLAVANLRAMWSIATSMVKAVRLMRRDRPAVVLAVGGYASVACAVAAVVLRVPLVVAEQNARAGLANRLVSLRATACAVPFSSTDLRRAVVTGNPTRAGILAVGEGRGRDAARVELRVADGRTLVLVFAGSLGARRINEAVLDLAERWQDRTDVAIHHVLGERGWEDLGERARALRGAALDYRPVRYEDQMPTVLAATDVAVCRAGGTTVAELAVVGVPAVLVPLPIATRDHQTANARELVDAGAAVLVPDEQLTGERLAAELEPLVADAARLAGMRRAAIALGRPDAAAKVADLLEARLR
jgi:UDP-N-acetylglucosamine--N-acetylmuramyl-(pentapeptide) pyrophosphoryl-undecaprenol N-acetylglucosamine transferase